MCFFVLKIDSLKSMGGAKDRENKRKQGDGGGKGEAGRGVGNAATGQEREIPLQAVVLADSFKRTFRPVTLECPKVLLPLVNVPMLEYTLEFLAKSGIEEI